MLTVLVSFLYIGITSFMLGFALRLGIKKYFGYEINEITGILYAGLGAAVVYAGFYSLFDKVGLGCNVVLLLFCAFVAAAGRRELRLYGRRIREKITPVKGIFLLLLLLIFAYGTSRGYMHVDSGLYHAQAIRWIEEYGVTAGLGNLHCRLAYNSSAFLLTALYSMSFWLGQSLHTVAGFMAMVLAAKAFSVTEVWKRKKVLVSDFVKAALLFYLSVIYTEMVSPASDYFAMLFLFYIVLKWTELEEKGEKDITPYGMLCVLLAVTVTIKLSAAIMLLLVLKPAAVLLKEKRFGQIGIYLCLGIMAVTPYLVRNVILSGWLVYPFAAVDLFSFDWKIPKGEVLYDAAEIKVYAKGMRDVLLQDTPIREWLPNWFSGLKGLEKVWVLGSLGSLGAGSIAFLIRLLQQRQTGVRTEKGVKQQKAEWGLWFLEGVLMAGYLFWQLGTPLVRYGYIYILAFPFFTAGMFFVFFFTKYKKSYLAFAGMLLLFFGYKGVNLGKDIWRFAGEDYYITQQDYETGPYESYEIDGITFYVPLEYGQIGYEKFPSSPYVREDVTLRSDRLKDGFRRSSEQVQER